MNHRLVSIAFVVQWLAWMAGSFDGTPGPSYTLIAQEPEPAAETAAETGDASVPPREPEKVVHIYDLTYAHGHELHSILQAVCPQAIFTVDSRANRIIILALPKEHSRLRGLIEQLDVGPQEDTIRVFNLLHVEANSMLPMIMQIAGGSNARLVVDPRTNSLVAAGSSRDIAVIEALATRLDQQAAGLQERSFGVRIVWLAAIDAEAEESEGLSDVARDLSTHGIEGLRPIGQATAHTAAGGTFQLSCSAKLADIPADMHIQGGINLRHSVPYLSINVSAVSRPAAPGANVSGAEPRQLVTLATEFTVPNDRYTILGVIPVEGKTLAFAVQVRAME
jgi:hypothetical protein